MILKLISEKSRNFRPLKKIGGLKIEKKKKFNLK